MKKQKILLIVFILSLLVGCQDKTLYKAYNNMQFNKISGYFLSILIEGQYLGESIKEEVKLINNKNKDFEIVINNNKIKKEQNNFNFFNNKFKKGNEDVFRIKNGKNYKLNSLNKDVIYEKDIFYLKHHQLLEGLNHIDEVKKIVREDKIKIYEVSFNKELIHIITENTVIENIDKEQEITGMIEINNNLPSKIIYNIGDVKMTINYTRINNVPEIKLNK